MVQDGLHMRLNTGRHNCWLLAVHMSRLNFSAAVAAGTAVCDPTYGANLYVDNLCICRYGYERDLLRLLEQHIRDMDRKIAKAKERAEKESAPRELKSDDKERLAEIQLKIKGWLC